MAAYDRFLANYQLKYPKACDCLEKDKEVLFTFYAFLAEHWSHLRTTNPLESTFATVRLRTQRTKECGSRITTLTMVYKLGLEAQKAWRRLNAAGQIAKIISGTPFVDGVEATESRQAAYIVTKRKDAIPPRTQLLTISRKSTQWAVVRPE